MDDMVEVLIDANNDKESCWKPDDIVYHVNLLSVKKDDRGTDSCKSNPRWNGIATFSVKLEGTLNNSADIDSGYSVVLVIPWTEINLKPKAGLSIGINFATGDNDGKGEQLYDWVGANVFRSPQLFGNLILQD